MWDTAKKAGKCWAIYWQHTLVLTESNAASNLVHAHETHLSEVTLSCRSFRAQVCMQHCSFTCCAPAPVCRYADKEVQRDAKMVSYKVVDKGTKPYVEVDISGEKKARAHCCCVLHFCEALLYIVVFPTKRGNNFSQSVEACMVCAAPLCTQLGTKRAEHA
jgi:hypothetical protein